MPISLLVDSLIWGGSVGHIYNQERSAELYENARLVYVLEHFDAVRELQMFAQGYSVSIRVGLGIEDTIIFNFDYTQPGWWKP
jgi:hypothetical protein